MKESLPIQTPRDLLQDTILNPDKEKRAVAFEQAWNERWNKKESEKQGAFQTHESESPFSEFSSKGWKIHLAFKKGEEKRVTKFLYENGLYFKIESVAGTYFNGNVSSGSTIYIGSRENAEKIAELIEQNLGDVLENGRVATSGGRKIPLGSGSDIELVPKVMARLDVAKTPFGWLGGNGKYAEHGLPSWSGFGGLPILKKYEHDIAEAESKWNKLSPGQRKIYANHLFSRVFDESKAELIKDFGEEFVLGRQLH